jgi:hypothetical protein
MPGIADDHDGLLTAYRLATANEIALDETVMGQLGTNSAALGYPPRALKWKPLVDRMGKPLVAATAAARFMWPRGLAAAHFRRQRLHAARYRRSLPPVPAELLRAARHVIAFSSRTADIVRVEQFPEANGVWITMPWAKLAKSGSRGLECDVFALLDGADLVLAERLANRAVAEMARREDARLWILQTYTAFHWMCTALGLAKLRGQFLICQHYDRWAVLSDFTVARMQRLGFEAPHPRLTLVQHGIVRVPSRNDSAIAKLDLPYKLSSVDKLYVYDGLSEAFFRSEILSAESTPNVVHFHQGINLAPAEATDKFRILFVGHPVCEALQIQVLQDLKRSHAFVAYYKPHPLSLPGADVARQEWTVVTDRSTFPVVDLLVSYPSTLVHQYAAHGTPTCLHPLGADAATVSKLSAEVSQAITASPAR